MIYIKCPGPCKKTFFKFGKSIEMHLKKSNCSKEVPSTFLPRLKEEFQEFKAKRRKISKHRYYLQNKSKRQKTTPLPSPTPRDEHREETEDSTNSRSLDDGTSEDGRETEDATENSVESSEDGNNTEEIENNPTSDDESSSKEICRGCSRECENPYRNPGYNSILGTLHKLCF